MRLSSECAGPVTDVYIFEIIKWKFIVNDHGFELTVITETYLWYARQTRLKVVLPFKIVYGHS